MRRVLISMALLIGIVLQLRARDVKGIVRDSKTGEPLIGTTIKVQELPNVATTTGLDGTFSLRNMPNKGHFTIIVSYAFYQTQSVEVDVTSLSAQARRTDGNDILSVDLEEDVRKLGEVVVTGHKEHHSDRSARELTKNAERLLGLKGELF